MTRAILLLGLATSITACVATTRTNVRDLDGNPQPTYSQDEATLQVRCHNGRTYAIVPDAQPLGAKHNAQVLHFVHTDGHTLCAKILASGS